MRLPMKLTLSFSVASFLLVTCSVAQPLALLDSLRDAGQTNGIVLFSGPRVVKMFDEFTIDYIYNVSVTTQPINTTGLLGAVAVDNIAEFLRALPDRTFAELTDTVSSTVKSASIVSVSVNYSNPSDIFEIPTFNISTALEARPNSTRVAIVIITITANRVGHAEIVLRLNDTESNNSTVVGHSQVIIFREYRMIDMIFRWVITAFVIFVTFGMGCELDLKIIWTILKKPFAPLIGFVSQYLLMPAIAIGIGQLFLNTPEMKLFGFGMLAVGCSPGGGGSNMWTILLGGDLNLSMTMTAISTTMALGMMPLWLFLTAPLYIDVERVKIPYDMIIIQLIQFVVPTLFGVALKSWKPHVAAKFKGPVRWGSLGFFIFMMTFGTWVNWYMFRTIGYFPRLLPIGACLPWCGFLFGYILAFVLRQGHKRAITIGIETGIQNIGVPMLILRFAFPPPEGDIGAVMVIITAMFTPFPLYLALLSRGVFRCIKSIIKRARGESDSVDDEDGKKSAAVNGDKADLYLKGDKRNSESVEFAPLSAKNASNA